MKPTIGIPMTPQQWQAMHDRSLALQLEAQRRTQELARQRMRERMDARWVEHPSTEAASS